MQGVTARDIRLAYALEELFESAGGGGRVCFSYVAGGRQAEHGRGAEQLYPVPSKLVAVKQSRARTLFAQYVCCVSKFC